MIQAEAGGGKNEPPPPPAPPSPALHGGSKVLCVQIVVSIFVFLALHAFLLIRGVILLQIKQNTVQISTCWEDKCYC